MPELALDLIRDGRGRVGKREGTKKNSIALTLIHFGCRSASLSPGRRGQSEGNTQAAKIANGFSKQNKTTTKKKSFCCLKLSFTRAKWIETWRGRFILWPVYEMWRGGKFPNKTKQTKKNCQTEYSEKLRSKTILWLFDSHSAAMSHMLPPFIFRGSEATREEPLISDWRIGVMISFLHNLGGGGSSSFIHWLLQLGIGCTTISSVHPVGFRHNHTCKNQQQLSAN